MNSVYKISVGIIVLLLLSCAQITNVTGGIKDETPPQLVEEKTYPSNKFTKFNTQTITITFDEYFTLTNPKQNVFVSPTLENDLEYKIKGKSLMIDLNNQLKENTTYTINFGEAIKDYRAGNILNNFTYVFSTGDYIDSLQTKGVVLDALTQTPEADHLVLLYDSFDDSIVSKERPIYFAKTNKKGQFSIQNIKEGAYKVFSLKDENRNYLFDLPNEKVGWLKDSLLIDTSLNKSIIIESFEEDYIKQGVASKTFEYPGKLSIELKKPSDIITSQVLTNDISVLKTTISKNKDSIIYWIKNPKNEKFNIELTLDTLIDTISIYPYKKTTDSLLKLKKWSRSINKDDTITLEFTSPILSIDSINIIKDSTVLPVTDIGIDSIYGNVIFNLTKQFKSSYSFEILPNSLEDIYGRKNKDTIKNSFSTFEKDFEGSFTLSLANADSSVQYVLQVMQANNIIKEVIMLGNMNSIPQMKPGKYRFKLIVDRNKNGKWDTGNYYNNITPEKVISYKKEVEIRSNWEVKEIWDLEKSQ